MTDHPLKRYAEHVGIQESRLCRVDRIPFVPKSMVSGLDEFSNKTLAWYNPTTMTVTMTELHQLIWSIEYGCKAADGFVNSYSLDFLGISYKYETYALRRNLARHVKEQVFDRHPNLLREHFRCPPATLLSHPFADVMQLPGAKVMYMMVIDKDPADVDEEDVKQASDKIVDRVRRLDTITLLTELKLALSVGQLRSDPLELHRSDEETSHQ